MTLVGLFLLAAAVACVTTIVSLSRRALATPAYLWAPARGSARRGVLAAVADALAPWRQEAGRRHFLTVLALLITQIAVVVALASALVATRQEGVRLLSAARGPIVALLVLGLACSLLLLGRRTVAPRLRRLSVADDFVASMLVCSLLGASVVALLRPSLLWFGQLVASCFLLYLPLGALRTVLFAALARWHNGRGRGRRGVSGRYRGATEARM